MPAVSVIIPTYNHRDYIVATLQSVFAQTFTDYEIIVVNDGSPDDTETVLAPFIQSDRIRYIAQPNAGQASARNRGISEARGEFIALLDDDDLWPADKLAWQVAALQSNPSCPLVGGAMNCIDSDSRSLGPLPSPATEQTLAFRDLFIGSPFLSPGQTLIRTNSLRSAGSFDPSIWGADDWELYFRLANLAPLRVFPRTALYYRLHASNASRDAKRMFANTLKVVRKHLPAVPRDARRAASRDAYRNLFYYLLRLEANGPRRLSRRLAFVRPALRDTLLLKLLLRDILPHRIHQAARSLTSSTAPCPLPPAN